MKPPLIGRNEGAKRDTPSPLPKINVPPPSHFEPASEEKAISTPIASWRLSHDRAGLDEPKVLAGRPSIRWDVRFTLSLILLIVAVNAVLALLLGGMRRPDALLSLRTPQAESPFTTSLPDIAPAAGAHDRITVYVPADDRRALIEQLQHTPQPGMVSRPAPAVLPPAPSSSEDAGSPISTNDSH